MRWRIGLRASIALTIVLISVGATTAMAAVVYHAQSSSAWDRFQNSAITGFRSDAQQAAGPVGHLLPACQDTPEECAVGAIGNYMQGRLGLTWALVDLIPGGSQQSGTRDGNYRPAAGNTGKDPGQLPIAMIDEAHSAGGVWPVTYRYDSGNGAFLVVASVVGPNLPNLVLTEFYSTVPLDREVSILRAQLIIIAAVVTLAAIVVGLLAARIIQRPVRTAAAAARQLGRGVLDTRLTVYGRDELAELAGAFNAMAQRLGESIEQLRRKDAQQRRFVADVAHDLRTPLASLVALTDSLSGPDPADRARSVELLGTQVRRLTTLVEDLLEISRFDAGAAELRPEPVNLAELATDAAGLVAPDAAVAITSSGDATVRADPRRLHTIMRNLLANAVGHGAPPVTVTIDGSRAHEVSVAVADSGPGLPADLAPLAFDRFVRGDRARAQTEGSGLGLAIAYENAALHGGRITVHNTNGAVFTLVIPRHAPPAAGPVQPG